MKGLKRIIVNSVLLITFLTISACGEFLDIKPDKKLVVINSSNDLLALMNHVGQMNNAFPSGLGEMASDNLYITTDVWNFFLGGYEDDIYPYIWSKVPVRITHWNGVYRRVLQSNVVIEQIDRVSHNSKDIRDEILGMAYFFRGASFFDLSQAYAVPYNKNTASERLGIVLRLSPDVNEVSIRSSLKDSFDQIISDLLMASKLLPTRRPLYPTRPYKGAAYAALARTYLVMRDYEKAGKYADSALMLQNELMDYKVIADKDYPFERFNKEVIFHSQMTGGLLLASTRMRVDSNLMTLYEANDLRRKLFFRQLDDGHFTFVGDYGEELTADMFSGTTTAEMLLIRAESHIRDGEARLAIDDLLQLQKMRYNNADITYLEGMSDSSILHEILLERRKELVFRGIRWSDIRRLNEEFPLRLEKSIGTSKYVMESEDIKNYAFAIPQIIIERTTIEQN